MNTKNVVISSAVALGLGLTGLTFAAPAPATCPTSDTMQKVLNGFEASPDTYFHQYKNVSAYRVTFDDSESMTSLDASDRVELQDWSKAHLTKAGGQGLESGGVGLISPKLSADPLKVTSKGTYSTAQTPVTDPTGLKKFVTVYNCTYTLSNGNNQFVVTSDL